ncbi:MAG: hypothetical protein K9J12_16560 [Melioribacteraceae bacterium]|nr:hypothetical protein [Melioribacteraceae bacterium]MCF8265991.1 hypothetical protein [Melioribacteraceae bacterium]MCF8430799.1 hypothetical protein [Melioribacteraceae bacterium]
MSENKYKTTNSISGKRERYELTAEFDQSWTFEETIERSYAMKLKLAPCTKEKALYSDTNYQSPGRIMEIITDKTSNTMIKLIQ